MRGCLWNAAWMVPAALLAGFVACDASAQSAAPAALVEDVSAGVADIEAFDYVPAGKQIKLGGAGRLVLGYLDSCVEETVIGGTVTVGADQSMVAGGSVERKTVACTGKPLQLSTEQSGTSGGLVFRKPPSKNGTAPAATPAPDRPRLIPGSGPVISVPKSGRVTIARVDAKAAPVVLDLLPKPVDLAKRGIHLMPGGTYRASYGSSSVVFEIDTRSTGDASPLTRLIRF